MTSQSQGPNDPLQPLATDAATGASESAKASPTERAVEPEWWQADGLPFSGKPSKAELWCYGAFAFTGIYNLVLLPFRSAFASWDINLWAGAIGSRLSVITLGAFTSTGHQPLWWLTLLLATLTVMKFDLIYWWAGKLWGHGLLDAVVGKTKFSQKNAARAEKLAGKYGAVAILLTYFVPIIPMVVVFVVNGLTGMSWKKFLLYNFIGSLLSRALYFYLGYTIGQPVVDVFNAVEKYLIWFSYVLIGVAVFLAFRQAKRAPTKR